MSVDPFPGRIEITAEEWRTYVDGDIPLAAEIVPDWKTKESAFQAKVVKFATEHGWMSYHTWKSANSAPGFPDLVMVRDDRTIFAELKCKPNKPTAMQHQWLNALILAGQETHIWYPEDFETIEEVLS